MVNLATKFDSRYSEDFVKMKTSVYHKGGFSFKIL